MATPITRAEYEAKFGKPVPKPVTTSAPTKPAPVMISRSNYEAKFGKSPETGQAKDGFLKSIVKAPATMLVRPIQVAAEAIMPGDNTAQLDKFSREKLGGFVAPIPQNFKDVKKDVGRGAQTVAWGMPGLASSGAVFGAGSSLEKGNDLLSTDTAIEAGVGAAGAKVAGAVLNPIFKGAGKLINKTPVGKKVTQEAGEFLARGGDDAISRGAQKVEDAINAPFSAAKKAVLPKPEDLVSKNLGIGNSAKAKQFKQLNKGESMEEYLVRTGNINNPEQTMINEFNKAKQSRISGEEMMKEVPGIHKNEFVEEAIKGLIDKEKKIGVPGGDSKEIIALVNKYNRQGGLTFSEANRVKQLYEKNVKLDFLKEKAADSIARANRIDQGIRQWQRNTAKKGGFTNLADIMKQTQNARMVADALYRKSLGSSAPSGISLMDAVLLSGGDISSLAMAGARKLFSGDRFRTALARAGAKGKPVDTMIKPERGPIRDMFLNAPKAGTPKTTQGPITTRMKSGETIFSSPKGSATPIKQEAVDIASVDLKKAKAPKPGRNLNRQKKVKEAMEGNQRFVDPKTLPSFNVGKKPKIGDVYKGLPVAKEAPNVATPKRATPYTPDSELPVIDFGKSRKGKQGGFTSKELLGAGAAGTGAITGGSKLVDMYNKANTTTYYPKSSRAEAGEAKSKPDIRKGFIHAENRGAVASGEDVYKVKGVTGDLGKYQVKPETLKDWSGPWLGKTMTPNEFLNDPKAQEEFMNQFEAMVDRYGLTPEETAIVWHKGWGVLGDSKPLEEKKKALRKHIDSKRDEAADYVKTFMEGLNK